MATHRISILAGAMPDASGRCRIEPYTVKATNDLFPHLVVILDDPSAGQEHGIGIAFNVPKNYVGAPKIVAAWTSTAISGNCRMRSRYRAIGGDDAESLDQATYQETVAVTDVAPSAAHERNMAEMALTAANLAADDTVELYFTRLDDTGTDTMAAAMILHDLILEYSDA